MTFNKQIFLIYQLINLVNDDSVWKKRKESLKWQKKTVEKYENKGVKGKGIECWILQILGQKKKMRISH